MATFLIVDGDRNFRETLAIALRLDGHLAQVAASAEDALLVLGRTFVECCVVDAHLPQADAVLESAARTGARTVVTGPYADLLAHAARRHPHVEPLPKPFAPGALAPSGG